MYLARSLVSNLATTASELTFRDFRIYRPTDWRSVQRFEATSPLGPEYLYERRYAALPSSGDVEVYGSIPADFEETVLLLRLYRVGDIAFSPLVVLEPNGSSFSQQLYPVTYPLRSLKKFKFEQSECDAWSEFADQLRTKPSWHSDWFAIARRFFLQGSSKKLNTIFDQVDRVVDFAIALEATLVPEKDFSSRRMRERAAALDDQGTTPEARRRTVKALYDLRSKIVHGSALSHKDKKKLDAISAEIESVIRGVIVAALRSFPPDEHERSRFCTDLWDVSDIDRIAYISEQFRGLTAEAKELFLKQEGPS